MFIAFAPFPPAANFVPFVHLKRNQLVLLLLAQRSPLAGHTAAAHDIADFPLILPPVKLAVLRHGIDAVPCKNQVVDHADADHVQRADHRAGGIIVVLRGFGHAAGVVVRQNDGTGSGVQSVLHHLPHMDRRGGNGALADAAAGQELALAVQTHLIQKLPFLPRQQLHEVGAGAIR